MMNASRRNFFRDMLFTGALGGFFAARPSTAEALLSALQAGDDAPPPGEHDSKNFWTSFVPAAQQPASGVHGRGLFSSHKATTGAADVNRQLDWLQYDPQKGLRYASAIDPSELLEYPAETDITASVNVGGFRMAGEDQAKFEQLQSAQLRIDVLQQKSLLNLLDPMAWTCLAALYPDKAGQLPPLQNLSFDPGSSWEKMQKIILPGGSGQIAVNVSMAHKESTFVAVLKSVNSEINRFAPILGLPAISTTALNSFCTLYGSLEQRTTFLLNGFPQQAYATRGSRASANTSNGLNIVQGDYVLVPHVYASQLEPYFDKLELRQGFLVAKGASTNASIYDLAGKMTPDITYVTANLKLAPVAEDGSPGSSGGGAAPSSGSGKSSGKKKS
ncbi:MAG TPA: hypothetical protein VMD97_03185 [Candidatus Aquilonibacter sp.]|nr:hypothetical protein [Candidatus Aquilonibacter sp.]